MQFTQRAAQAATANINEILCPMLDAALVAKTKAEYEATRGSGEGEVAAKRIGAGYIGTECMRALAFRYHKNPKEDREGSVSAGELQRHADSGHWTEAKTKDWLGLVGLDVVNFEWDRDANAPKLDPWGKPKQIGWKSARDPVTGQYRMAGEVDGVIREVLNPALAQLIKPPCIWESKKGTDKKWKKFSKEGVKKADPRYYGQLQTNMAYMDVKQTLFSMLNLDNMKYFFELVPFNQADAQAISDRAVKVLESANAFEMPALCRSADDFNGRYCDFHGQCQCGLKLPMPAEPAAGVVFPNTGACSPPLARPVFNPNFPVQ